jgi:mersacidin/lichenicidin family type 2 lantibiotic
MNSIKVWKDPEYRRSLSAEELTQVADNPVGLVELSDDELNGVAGGTTGWWCATVALTVTVCSPTGTLCGSCQVGTRGCC